MGDALAGRNGWDALLHPAEQDLAVARASAAWLRHRYQQAVTAEQSARQDTERARRAAAGLRHEARIAAAEATRLGPLLPVPGRIRVRPGYATAPVPAL